MTLLADRFVELGATLPKVRPWIAMREWFAANTSEQPDPTIVVFNDGSRAFRDDIYSPWQTCSLDSWEVVTNA